MDDDLLPEVPGKTVTTFDESQYAYDQLASGEPYDWGGAARGDHPHDNIDFHVDLGCGRAKKGRFGIDRFYDEGVNWVQDLDARPVLPFADESIKSIVTHHFLEHLSDGFLPLMDECHRVLEIGGIMRIIVPLFPSYSAISDPDHKRMFLVETFDTFCGSPDGDHWMESFSTPYTACRFAKDHEDYTARSTNPSAWWMPGDSRELRVTLRKQVKHVDS